MVKNFIAAIIVIALAGFGLYFEKFFFSNILSNNYGKLMETKAYPFELETVDSPSFPIKLSDFRGKDIYLFFGFSKCSGVCPVNLQTFYELSRRAKDLEKVSFLFISIDPIRDTKDQLRDFQKALGAPVMLLTSGKDNTHKVAKEYFSRLDYNIEKIKADESYQFQHTGHIYHINSKGLLKFIYPYQKINSKKIMKDNRKVFHEF
jgi:protein SCO1